MENSNVDEEMGITPPPPCPDVSGITFDDAVLAAGINTSNNSKVTPNGSPNRKIKKEDMTEIFRASHTVGSVSQEQLARIKFMHDKICDGVNWDFNYCCLLTVASVVAGLGLATNSATTVISSMLLSPIMGPVIGMSYGLIIWDLPLIKRSVANELLSIVACIIFGMLIGITTFWTEMANNWPTAEMNSRATRVTFLTGFPIAFFSGLGVALSVLDDSTSSLVGVAISASLLPPAVNSGILLVMAFIRDEKWGNMHLFQATDALEYNTFSQGAIMSLLLTIANIICVALGATLMFRVKEVLPVKKKVFWDDLKIARRIFQGRATDQGGEVVTVRNAREMLLNPSGSGEDPSHSGEEITIPVPAQSSPIQ